jgi:hypothetical protein
MKQHKFTRSDYFRDPEDGEIYHVHKLAGHESDGTPMYWMRCMFPNTRLYLPEEERVFDDDCLLNENDFRKWGYVRMTRDEYRKVVIKEALKR